MSWNPLKKKGVQKQASFPVCLLDSHDDNFDAYLRNLQVLDENSRRFHKEVKKCTEYLVELAKSEQKITNNLASSHLCHYDEKLRTVTEEYYSISKAMDANTNELILVSKKAVLEPVKKYNNIFTHLNALLKKRDQQIQECQKTQAKLTKLLMEKTGPNVAKSIQVRLLL